MRILLVEDDHALGRFLALALREDGHAVDYVGTGEQGDLFAVARPLRHAHPAARTSRPQRSRPHPAVAPQGHPDSHPRSHPLSQCGARDPRTGCRRRRLSARTPQPRRALRARRALGRRRREIGAEPLRVGNVHLDSLEHEVRVSRLPLPIPAREFKLLEYLLARPDEVVSRTQLLEAIWEMHFDPRSNLVDVLVSRLRGTLVRANAMVAIESVRGTGFVLRRLDAQDPRSAACDPALGIRA